MDIQDLVTQRGVLPAAKANSKKQLLQLLAARSSELTGISEREIFDVLLQRERLGSTGTGHGVAVPHGKLASLDRLVGVFARLETPIPYDAIDDEPVDIVFMLLAPEDAGADHLKALARIARFLRNEEALRTIRGMQDAEAIYDMLTNGGKRSDAA